MKIKIAEHSGFCFGVKRALKIARNIRKEREGRVFTLGNLIHNKRVVEELKNQGIDSVEDISKIDKGTAIIRSHGISPRVIEELKKKGIEIIDATCPFVKRIQKLAEKLAKEDYEIIIVGNKNHPEIIGVKGYTEGKEVIVENIKEALNLPKKNKRAVIAQSTQDVSFFKEVVNRLIEKTRELRIFDTICDSTKIRQNSTRNLAEQVQVMFIVGDRKSSNTNKLYNLSKRIQPRTYFIERAGDLTLEMISHGGEIGISAGASTPPELLEEVIEKIRELKSKTMSKGRGLQWLS